MQAVPSCGRPLNDNTRAVAAGLKQQIRIIGIPGRCCGVFTLTTNCVKDRLTNSDATGAYATISKDGTLQNVRLIGEPSILSDATLRAIKTWRYHPHIENGIPVDAETQITIDFTK
jgi:Gram-negative bacterial TonB protein C-terminal